MLFGLTWRRATDYIGAHNAPGRAQHERARALQRIVIAGSVPIVVLIELALGTTIPGMRIGLAFFGFAYAIEAFWYLRSVRDDPTTAVGLQHAFMVVDPIFVVLCLYLDPSVYAFLFAFLPFMVIGVGIRFGVRAMWLEWAAVLLAAVILLPQSEFWRSRQLFVLSSGGWLLLTPILFGNAIRQLQRVHALEIEHAQVRAKNEFLARVGHELRSPLQRIVNTLDLWELRIDKSARAEDIELADRVRRACAALSTQIRDLLTVARGEAGKLEYRPEPCDARSILQDAANELATVAHDKGLELTVALPKDPVHLLTDPVRLGQIVINLLSNSVRNTREGSIRLTLDPRNEESQQVRFHVKDTGTGIAPHLMPRIFQPFERGDSPGQAEGAGLGLAIVQSIAKLIGATISLESKEGSGTTVTVSVPAAPSYDAAPSNLDPGQPIRR